MSKQETTLKTLFEETTSLHIDTQGVIYDNKKVARVRYQPKMHTALQEFVGKVTKLSDVLIDVSESSLIPNGLCLQRHIDIKDVISKNGSVNIDADTGEVRTLAEVKLGDLPSQLLTSIRGTNTSKVEIQGEFFFVSRDGSTITLKRSSDEFTTIQDIIDFGITNNASNVTISKDNSTYRIQGRSGSFKKIYQDKELKTMLHSLDKGVADQIQTMKVYRTTKVIDGTSVNIHVVYDNSPVLIFDFIKNQKRQVTDFFDTEWLAFLKSRNQSEHGGLVIVSEKQDLPDIIPMFLNAITQHDDIVLAYHKPVPDINAQVLSFSNHIPLHAITNINSDVTIMDFMTATSNWDSIYEMIDNGSVVVLTVNESSIYMTLNMIVETFEKNYQYRKFIDTLLGINVVAIQYQTDTTAFTVKYDYIYNNKQFQILLGSKTYSKLDLADKKYKHYFLSLGGEHKSIEAVLREILEHANNIGAHDISLSAGAPPAFRKGRDLVFDYIDDKLLPYMTESMFLEIVQDPLMQEEFRRNPGRGLPYAYSVPGIGRYRVNVYKQRGSIAMSLRKIPDTIFSMDWCGLQQPIQEQIINAKTGLILVTGPTGSGKSTTLASIIDYYNQFRAHKIITTEDPIEYLHSHKKALVEQIEIGQDTDSFIHTLESNMRNNPDILLIGEIRDAKTLGVALNASVTGHLVLATLHTKGAIETIQRILDMVSVDDRDNIKSLLSQNLILTITQQLLPRKGGGLIGTHECMVVNDPVRIAIAQGDGNALKQIESQLASNRDIGMCDMNYAIAQHVLNGYVDLKDAETYAPKFERVKQYVKALQKDYSETK